MNTVDIIILIDLQCILFWIFFEIVPTCGSQVIPLSIVMFKNEMIHLLNNSVIRVSRYMESHTFCFDIR